MGATLLDGVVVEKHAMVAAGSLVRENTRIPSGEVSFYSLFLFWFTFYCVCDKHIDKLTNNSCGRYGEETQQSS